MTPQEQALQSWREDKANYEKKARKVISDLCESMQILPSPAFQGKLEELKEYLRYNYAYDDDENFMEVYVQSIAGKRNISVMELANKLVQDIGGTTKFWQKKITDVASYVNYHPQLSVWEANNFYQRFLGLDPETASHLRKKKALAKKYLTNLSSICKLIDRSKPFEEDLVKIDEQFLKLKRAQEEYYAFLQETQNRRFEAQGLSSKGLLNAKKNLFMFFKPKEQKLNTLINYNFKCRKSAEIKKSKLMEKNQYAEFDALLQYMKNASKSQRFNNFNKSPRKSNPINQQSVPYLRSQFFEKNKKAEKPAPVTSNQGLPVYIWSKQFFFSYVGYIVKSESKFDYTSPFQRYANINYQIDSEQEFDEFNAEDVDINQSEQSNSLQDQNSFIVSDFHDSDREEELKLKQIQENYFTQKWVKNQLQINENYRLIGFQIGPLPLQENEFCAEQMIGKASGKSRAEILTLFEEQHKQISKNKIDHFLRNNFKKIRSKDKKIIYVRAENKEKKENASDNQTNDNYEISISYASKPKRIQNFQSDATILQQSEVKSTKEKPI